MFDIRSVHRLVWVDISCVSLCVRTEWKFIAIKLTVFIIKSSEVILRFVPMMFTGGSIPYIRVGNCAV